MVVVPPSATSETNPEVFSLRGDLNSATAGRLRRDLSPAAGQRAVLLDLTEVAFIDAVGLGVILATIRAIHQEGGVVAIAGAEPQRGFPGALRAAGIHDLVPLTSSVAAGVAWLNEAVSE
jgi:anti-anti-sigma factor